MKRIYDWPHHVQLAKTAVWTVAMYMCVRGSIRQRRVRQRQAKDATSEWERYAHHPAARGRALVALLARLLPLYILTQLSKQAESKVRWRTRSGEMFSNGLLRLGPLYVKLGQIVSCQDRLPPEWVVALEQLQDRVPAKAGREALELAYASVGSPEFETTFSDLDTTPLAAASLGQVHKAVLRETNETVAIKLQRPYLRQIYDQDLTLLLKLANLMDRFGGSTAQVGGVSQSWTDIFTDAKDILYREIDYRDEEENAVRFARDFGLGKGGRPVTPTAKSYDNETLPSAAPWLRTPYIYPNLSSEKALVMEYVPSIKITDASQLEAANITNEEKEYLADSLARAYLRQFTVNRFFSTDPHPGNLGVERVPGTQKPRLVIYDFGQACELTHDQAHGILQVIEAIVDMRADTCVQAFDRMGVLTENANLTEVQAKVQNNFDTGKVQVKRKKLKRAGYKFQDAAPVNRTNSTTTSAQPPKDSTVMSYFTLPAEYAFVARALAQMHGVGKTLDPDFDFISSAAPQLVEVKGVGSYLKDEWSKWWEGVQTKVDSFLHQ